MARRSLAERIAELEEKGRQLEARRQALEARLKEQARRQRTRGLIQVGGVLARLGVVTVAEAEQLRQYAEAHPEWWRQWQSTT